MRKYTNLIILINYILIILLGILPSNILVWGQLILLFVLVHTYLVGDKQSPEFLKKFKYNFLAFIGFFVIFRDYPGFYKASTELSMSFSKIIIIVSIFIFGFLLLKEDRLNYNKKGK